jgi:hypothetical protein
MNPNSNPRSPKSTSSIGTAAGGSGYPYKRARHNSPDSTITGGNISGSPKSVEGIEAPLVATGGKGGGSKAGHSSSFRNVSACNRCRLRKNRCDQRLPSCASCEKANVKCVGYDPITKREIPRR